MSFYYAYNLANDELGAPKKPTVRKPISAGAVGNVPSVMRTVILRGSGTFNQSLSAGSIGALQTDLQKHFAAIGWDCVVGLTRTAYFTVSILIQAKVQNRYNDEETRLNAIKAAQSLMRWDIVSGNFPVLTNVTMQISKGDTLVVDQKAQQEATAQQQAANNPATNPNGTPTPQDDVWTSIAKSFGGGAGAAFGANASWSIPLLLIVGIGAVIVLKD